MVKPWDYYDNNISGTLVLVDVMRRHGCKSIIFSSSATVYGDPAVIPVPETCPKGRCTNPYGQTKSMLEDPNGVPNNLMPYITQVAVGKLDHLNVFGDDYDTPDGTGVRDYIHVVDLAEGHVKALKAIEEGGGVEVFNLGTGRGYSVLEVVHAFERASGVKIPYVIVKRRPGDIAACYADPAKARAVLGWKAERGIEEMCRDSWNWQKNNPNGFQAD